LRAYDCHSIGLVYVETREKAVPFTWDCLVCMTARKIGKRAVWSRTVRINFISEPIGP
jgi:hypothetical protein